MKILFLGDYSGYHATLARALREQGHDCTVVSSGSRCMDTERDIDVTRKPGFLGSVSYLANILRLVSRFKDFDIVQLVNPGFFQLRPDKLRYFFDKLKRQNEKIFLTMAGSDSLFVQSMVSTDILRYSEFKVNDVPTTYAFENNATIKAWLGDELLDYCGYIYNNVDGAISALYEYHVAAELHESISSLLYGGIPIDVVNIPFRPLDKNPDEPINILVAYKSEYKIFKGADRLLQAAQALERKYPERCKIKIASDLPLNEYMKLMADSDVVLDQLYSYTPATNALQAMALGKIVVSGAEDEFYEFIGEKNLRPIFNVPPNDQRIYDTLEKIIFLPTEAIRRLSYAGREFVEKHNASDIVAKRFLEAWQQSK